jgi:hypothetical protein
VLRLVVARGGRHPVYLVTSVLDEETLSDRQVIQIYGLRWGVEISHPHDVRNDTLYQPGQSGYRGCSGVTGTGTLVLQAA